MTYRKLLIDVSRASLRTRSFRRAWCAVAALLLALSAAPGAQAAQAQKSGAGIKVLIAVDMEGVGGTVTSEQLNPPGFEYERFRRFMTDEALAAVRAAKAAGATTIIVTDSHSSGQNLFIEDFPRDVRIVRSWPRRGGIVAGLDPTFNAVILVGLHAASDNPRGVRAHTWSSATFTRVALNGRSISEGELAAATAGELGVPTVFISGDDATVDELRARIPNIETVATKQALGFHSALTMPPAESAARIEAGVSAALSRLREFKPYVIAPPVAVELAYKHYAAAEEMSYLPGVERVAARTVRFTTKSVAEAANFISFAAGYQPDLAP